MLTPSNQRQRERAVANYLSSPNICQACNSEILPSGTQRMPDVRKKRFCDSSCAARFNNLKRGKRRPEIIRLPREKISAMTKGDLFEKSGSWQSARSQIQRHSRGVFFSANPVPACAICDYSHHVEVAHIRPVSDFPSDSAIREINALANLIGLCPNHHWELDNGILVADWGIEPHHEHLMRVSNAQR